MPIKVLYEDKYVLVAVKPVGLVSEDTPNAKCMPSLLREYLSALGKSTYIATVHRLDKQVGGVMVFSRRPEITGKLTAAIAEHSITKEYFAVLRGHPSVPEATLKDLLFHDSAHNKSYVVTRQRKGVREAILDYKELERVSDFSLVRVHLQTGRTHQIRVQFSSRSLPLLGDIRYGSKADCSVALWACHLAFKHPANGKQIDISFNPPLEYPWNLFRTITKEN